jgi:hypothetical protein
MFTLAVRRYQPGATDAHGNPVESWSESQPWVVRGYAPGAMAEPSEANRDLSLIEWTVYADANDSAPGERDLVVLEGDEYAVEGRPADWTKGPWPHPTAGIVVELKRAEG